MSRTTRIRACYLPLSQLRPVAGMAAVFERCAALGFSHVVLPSPLADGDDPGAARLGDPARLGARWDWPGTALEGLSQLAAGARKVGLELVIDLRLDEVEATSPLVAAHPDCFRPRRSSDGPPPDPRRWPSPPTAAIARFRSHPEALTRWWRGTLADWRDAGVAGFRCLWPQRVPASAWRELTASLADDDGPDFWLWTPGLTPAELDALAGCGFTAGFSSLAWWDFRSPWYAEEDARLGRLPSVMAVVADPLYGATSTPALRARALAFAAETGDGIFAVLPDAVDAQADAALREANALLAQRGSAQGARRRTLRPVLGGSTSAAAAWLVEPMAAAGPGPTPGTRLLLVNTDAEHVAMVDTRALFRNAAAGGAFEACRPAGAPRIEPDCGLALEPAEVRSYAITPNPPARRACQPVDKGAAGPRVAVESVSPVLDGGRFPVKRTVGDRVLVEADILCDGHDRVAAAVLWRLAGQRQWRREPMRHLGNDRWCGGFTLDRIGRYEFTVEAWRDEFATARMDLEKRLAAGTLTAVDLDEVVQLVRATADAGGDAVLLDIAAALDASDDAQARSTILLAPDTATLMARCDRRPFLNRCTTAFQVDSERLAAGFSSWYELFPRSMAVPGPDGVQPHGTFDDVIARLPAIREMGFDVLYMPPIHPIGRRNRKGRNNSVTAEPGEPGSPYAIGADEGGHDAVHPELGTLDDFRRLVAAAASEGLEIALDFAIQCSPDHPWLREHPDWFAWRADGSIRYAENPPKKYEDIVNVDFYASGSIPGLWQALRDVVAFWVNEGVRLFRVDNPHTKPFPFWEWMIGDIRATHPDVVFLSEAFTRPKLMYRLAKVGYSQSYTYFTWRNTKAELIEYMTELADGPPADFFRPHFFVNTPDINPVFLHHSGRAGHLIRAALATTLSGLWGMYSGFELCEATPLKPGKEEYLDSEKYQLRQWDWDRPGNIVAEITRLNLLRRLNPALQTHLGITFYNAFNDNILYFGKRRGAREDMVLVAINLDPHNAHEADFELPLWEWGLPDHASVQVEDLWRGTRSTWQGKHQHLRLDPADLPFAIWRVGPGPISDGHAPEAAP